MTDKPIKLTVPQLRLLKLIRDTPGRDGLDPDEWGAPDGYNKLALCLPE